jgi:Cof subfamily protein (haloacid dehalogenase superfamily)
MSSPYRLLFLDVDGTLVSETDTISERTLTALQQAYEAGCTPVICTGRSRYTARMVADQLGRHGYGIYLNGGLIYDERTGERLKRVELPRETAHRAIELARSMQLGPLCFAMDEDDRWVYADEMAPILPQFLADFPDRMKFVNDLLLEAGPPPVSIETYGSREQADALIDLWRREFGPEVLVYGWESKRFKLWGAHIHSSIVDKGLAAKEIAEWLNVPREQAIAIGDEVNDVELLRWAGLGIAMGNGHEDCHASADHITAHCSEDGVAQAIERFILNA